MKSFTIFGARCQNLTASIKSASVSPLYCPVYCKHLTLRPINTSHIRFRHVMYLFNPNWPPTAVFFSTPDEYIPIPLNTTFSYLHLCLQGYLCISVFHLPTDRKIRTTFSFLRSNVLTSTAYTPPVDPHLLPLLISSIAPTLCILLRNGCAYVIWWCFCGAVFALDLLIQRGRSRDEAQIEGLENLKYNAKGA